MKKNNLILTIAFLLLTNLSYAQNCDCKANFEWVKKTFEENDAGFQHALNVRGLQAYAFHNKMILDKVKNAKTLNECIPILYEWLTFFRSGHIAIRPNYQPQRTTLVTSDKQVLDWETYNINTEDFKKYLDKHNALYYEGIWEIAQYKIGIKKIEDEYIGFIIESGVETWTKGQVKLRFRITPDKTNSVFYMLDRSAVESNFVTMIGRNYLQMGNHFLSRIYPKIEEDPKYDQYIRSLFAEKPYIEQLNETTLYFRMPSFLLSHKSSIDSILNVYREKILSTRNLIIDIRNSGGGSDASFRSIIPFLYTNPIRTVGVEFLSTELNNQMMFDFATDPKFGLDDETKKWAKESYYKLQSKLGQFVNLNESVVSIIEKDTIYPYPHNVGIIINEGNASASEQFLLAAKQSKKVKLFGVNTFGALDMSNMNFVDSPCKEFQLGYTTSRSMRIPGFTIDDKGIQPDFYLDKSIPLHKWTYHVNKILNSQ